MVKSITKFVGVGLLSLTLSVAWHIQPASAQVDDATRPVVQNENDGFDWGWIGLLGLLGLGGLMRRDRDHHRGPATTTTRP